MLKVMDTGVNRQAIVGIDPNGVRDLDGFIGGVTIEQGLFDQPEEFSAGVSVSGPTMSIAISSGDENGNDR